MIEVETALQTGQASDITGRVGGHMASLYCSFVSGYAARHDVRVWHAASSGAAGGISKRGAAQK